MAEEQVKEAKYREQIFKIAELLENISMLLREIDDVEVKRSVLAIAIKALLLDNEDDLFIMTGILDTVKFDIQIGSWLQSHADDIPALTCTLITKDCNSKRKNEEDATYI